jgi:3-isopropylmalate/(R)-2-methylmalate dehydratase small subunit
MMKYEKFAGTLAVLPVDNIDTDQIIPARFLKTISKERLGTLVFYDWRYEAGEKPKADFVLNQPHAQRAEILLAGENFGCGSSREHAAWALMQFGFRAVIAPSFGEIFRQNALKNALLPVVVARRDYEELLAAASADAGVKVTVDLAEQVLLLPGGRAITFPIDGFSKHCLLEGIDELGYVLKQEAAIAAFEQNNWCQAKFSPFKLGKI